MLRKVSYLIIFLVSTGFIHKPQTVADEYSLKAAFVYNFTRYIEWGATEQKKEFIIGIVGSSPISKSLDEIAATKTVDGKKIVIRKYNSPEEMEFCHIVFISQNATCTLNEILEKTATKGTLVVSEQKEFALQGTAINFIIVDSKLKFEVNTKSMNTAGLKASSQLLKLAILVNHG